MTDIRRPAASPTEEFSLDITHINPPLLESEAYNPGEDKQSFLEEYPSFDESPSKQERHVKDHHLSVDEETSLKKLVT